MITLVKDREIYAEMDINMKISFKGYLEYMFHQYPMKNPIFPMNITANSERIFSPLRKVMSNKKV